MSRTAMTRLTTSVMQFYDLSCAAKSTSNVNRDSHIPVMGCGHRCWRSTSVILHGCGAIEPERPTAAPRAPHPAARRPKHARVRSSTPQIPWRPRQHSAPRVWAAQLRRVAPSRLHEGAHARRRRGTALRQPRSAFSPRGVRASYAASLRHFGIRRTVGGRGHESARRARHCFHPPAARHAPRGRLQPVPPPATPPPTHQARQLPRWYLRRLEQSQRAMYTGDSLPGPDRRGRWAWGVAGEGGGHGAWLARAVGMGRGRRGRWTLPYPEAALPVAADGAVPHGSVRT